MNEDKELVEEETEIVVSRSYGSYGPSVVTTPENGKAPLKVRFTIE